MAYKNNHQVQKRHHYQMKKFRKFPTRLVDTNFE